MRWIRRTVTRRRNIGVIHSNCCGTCFEENLLSYFHILCLSAQMVAMWIWGVFNCRT
ncbi:uncharacterized protein BDW43DRAFT_273472 [Aspergillus alliaceus]|uniref:uncharacterized protein n=1 Tax=Petromyces alliaceus TaxID=209559 RepID=UPI0012A4372B|nr:uncharacterized protein BDW43DRAFT_273472 [Aspergillus alliaceus]KAB8234555.1 hypothetical protein BDW43DRAFT_273472 [Aspergillus alliaceus]